MICLQCNTRPICKVFDIIMTTSGLEADIKSCMHYRRQTSFESVVHTQKKELTSLDQPERDLNDVAVRIKKAMAVAAASNSNENKLKCAECGEEFPVNHMIICSECEKHFCETHSITDMSSKNSYCEFCWEHNAPSAMELPN